MSNENLNLEAIPGVDPVSTATTVAADSVYASSEYWPIKKLKLWDRNPRSIKGDRFNELKARLKRQGQIKPLLVTKQGVVIGGNMRLRAFTELGWSEVWVSVTDVTTDKEMFDLALTDNEEFGYYEQEQVAELALELGLSPVELQSYALSLGEPTTLDLVVDKFGPEEIEEDEVPEVDEINPPVSVEGEVYQLGRHRPMCGSSTDIEQVNTLLAGAPVAMVFTDPPYNAAFNGRSGNHEVILNDELSDGEFSDFIQEFVQTLYAVAPNAPKYVCTDWKMYPELYNLMEGPNACIVWVKNMFGMGNGYRHQHELIIFEGSLDANDQSDVWQIKRDSGAEYTHPTQKPVALPAKAIKNSSRQGENVLDMFGGSGPTLLAAEKLGRNAYLMELDPKYVDVIRKRYWKHVNGDEEGWEQGTAAVETIHASA